MKVYELISELEKVNKDLEVHYIGDGFIAVHEGDGFYTAVAELYYEEEE